MHNKQNPRRFQYKRRPFKGRFRGRFGAKKHGKRTLSSLLPNMTTILGMCCGLTAIRFAMLGHYNYSIVCIVLAAALDALDGRLARFLDCASQFGAELDSFSDLLTFGVTPSLVMYFYTLNTLNELGWVLVLFATVCMAIRLARFNVGNISEDNPAQKNWAKSFFTGVPAPAAGLLIVSPIVFHTTFKIDFFNQLGFCVFMVVFSGFMMISRIPTMSLKGISVPPKFVKPVLALISFLAALAYAYPWFVLSLVGLVYLGLIPFGILYYKALERKHAA